MARRWQRGRNRSEKPDGSCADPPAERGDHATRPTDDDLEARLAAVTSAFVRPPTAEELRAAFARRPPEPAPPQRQTDDFSTAFPAETLFTATADQAPAEEAKAEDRSRTTGDYYYDPDDAWEVLGLQTGAPWSEIALAHRRLAKQHHPDRLLDASATRRAASENTMREINVAYSVLRRLTGH